MVPTAELEILRGELSRILIEHTRDSTDFRSTRRSATSPTTATTSP